MEKMLLKKKARENIERIGELDKLNFDAGNSRVCRLRMNRHWIMGVVAKQKKKKVSKWMLM